LYDIPRQVSGGFFERIWDEARRLQRIFSIYEPESELSRLNSVRVLDASDELVEVVSTALGFCEATSGAYDISQGKRFIARKTGSALPETSCSFRDIAVDGNRIVLAHPDVVLDLGSIAKGYIGDKIIDKMRRIGVRSGFVDARGDMRVFGANIEVISIQHPRDREKTLRPFVLDEAAVATSGDYRQYWGSYDRSHIVGETDFISATVIAPTLTEADALASCLFLAGSSDADRLMGKYPHARAVAYDRHMQEFIFGGFEASALEAKIGH